MPRVPSNILCLLDKQVIHSLIANYRVWPSSSEAWVRGGDHSNNGRDTQFSFATVSYPSHSRDSRYPGARGDKAHGRAGRDKEGGGNNRDDQSHNLLAKDPLVEVEWGRGGCPSGRIERANNYTSTSPGVTYLFLNIRPRGLWASTYNLINHPPSPSYFEVNHLFASPAPHSTAFVAQPFLVVFHSSALTKNPLSQLTIGNHPFFHHEVKSVFDKVLVAYWETWSGRNIMWPQYGFFLLDALYGIVTSCKGTPFWRFLQIISPRQPSERLCDECGD